MRGAASQACCSAVVVCDVPLFVQLGTCSEGHGTHIPCSPCVVGRMMMQLPGAACLLQAHDARVHVLVCQLCAALLRLRSRLTAALRPPPHGPIRAAQVEAVVCVAMCVARHPQCMCVRACVLTNVVVWAGHVQGVHAQHLSQGWRWWQVGAGALCRQGRVHIGPTLCCRQDALRQCGRQPHTACAATAISCVGEPRARVCVPLSHARPANEGRAVRLQRRRMHHMGCAQGPCGHHVLPHVSHPCTCTPRADNRMHSRDRVCCSVCVCVCVCVLCAARTGSGSRMRCCFGCQVYQR
jgi:hypothetical protein